MIKQRKTKFTIFLCLDGRLSQARSHIEDSLYVRNENEIEFSQYNVLL